MNEYFRSFEEMVLCVLATFCIITFAIIAVVVLNRDAKKEGFFKLQYWLFKHPRFTLLGLLLLGSFALAMIVLSSFSIPGKNMIRSLSYMAAVWFIFFEFVSLIPEKYNYLIMIDRARTFLEDNPNFQYPQFFKKLERLIAEVENSETKDCAALNNERLYVQEVFEKIERSETIKEEVEELRNELEEINGWLAERKP
jgi:hypothetical protein